MSNTYYEFSLLGFQKDKKEPDQLYKWWGDRQDEKRIRELAYLSASKIIGNYHYYQLVKEVIVS